MGLAERDPEARLWARSCQGLVEVLDRLHKVRLTDDHVHAVGFLDGICAQVHKPLLAASCTEPGDNVTNLADVVRVLDFPPPLSARRG